MKVELLDSGILAKGLLSKKEIPYDTISVAFLRIEEVQAKVCCGKANFDRSFLVLVTNGKEEVIEMDSIPLVKGVLEKLKAKKPDIQIGKQKN